MIDRVQLVKRGIAFAGDCHEKFTKHVSVSKNPEDAEKFLKGIARRFQSPGAIILLGLTVFSALYLMFAVEYSIRFVATSMAIVEHTQQTGNFVVSDEPDAPLYKQEKAPLMEDLDEDQKLPVLEAAAALPIKPITSTLRSTFRHIRSLQGSYFRGARFFSFYAIVLTIFTIIFQAVFFQFAGFLGFWLGSLFAALACCNAHATWTHAMIADSDKSFFQRFLPRKTARALLWPTLRLHIAIGTMNLSVATLFAIAVDSADDDYAFLTMSSWLWLHLAAITAVVMGFGMVLPSYIALVRTEASLLPEDATAIVPFDRTFGGCFLQTTEVNDEVSTCAARRAACFKAATVRGAYMTFNKDTYKRTVRMMLKFVVANVAVNVVFIGILVAEVFFIAGGSENVRKGIEIVQAVQHGDL